MLRMVKMTACLMVVMLPAGAMPGTTVKNKVVLHLLDLSGSTKKGGTRDGYRRDVLMVLAGIRPGDRLTVGEVNDNPLVKSQFPVNEYFEKPKFWEDNELFRKAKERKTKAKIMAIVDKLLSDTGEFYKQTKLRDALLVAQHLFSVYSAAMPVLVISSDGIEEDAELNLLRENLTDARIEEIIQRDKKRGRLPKLQEVIVYFTGAGAGEYENLPSAKLLSIETFWRKYLRACGAVSVDYGPQLLRFEPEAK